MEQQVRRYALGIAGAGFVVVWTTLGFTTAALALAGALLASNLQRLREITHRRPRNAGPMRQRQAVRARPLRAEAEELPLVPDDPSLIINASGF